MNPTTAALAIVVLLYILLAIVAAYGAYAYRKLQKELDDMNRKSKELT